MSTPTTNAPSKRRTRYVRNELGRVVQVRQFESDAEIGSVCFCTNIIRDPTTQMAIGNTSTREKITKEDLEMSGG